MQSVDPQNAKNFWKKNNKVPGNIRPVYGAMHPPILRSPKSSPRKEGGQRKSEESDSFQYYQESVSDAWDCADDEFFNSQGVKLSTQIVQSTAMDVINSHRSGQLSQGHQVLSGNVNYLPELHTSHSVTSSSCPTQSLSSSLPASQSVSVERVSPPVTNMSPPVTSMSPMDGSALLPLSRLDPSSASHNRTPVINASDSERSSGREDKFIELIKCANTNLQELRKLSWSGIPPSVRATTWRLLNDYLPANSERREEILKRKRDEYWSFVKQYYHTRLEDIHQDTFRQIHIDIPRMSPLVPLFQQTIVQEMFERILYIWAIRHPASGYVQGINDLVTPFFIVFLHEAIPKGENLDTYEVNEVSEMDRDIVEADSYWCMSKLLDGIQNNYTFAQPGIQNRVLQLGELMARIDANLHHHLVSNEIDYLQFSFRWFNNLLMREMPLGCTVRLWDTLHAEQDGFSHFVLYVCAAFLKHFSQSLLEQRDFQGLMLLLQNLPTSDWSNKEISLLVAEAFRLKYTFADAPNHLQAPIK